MLQNYYCFLFPAIPKIRYFHWSMHHYFKVSISQKLHFTFTKISEFVSYILNIPLSALK